MGGFVPPCAAGVDLQDLIFREFRRQWTALYAGDTVLEGKLGTILGLVFGVKGLVRVETNKL